jgi:hypothetical protein
MHICTGVRLLLFCVVYCGSFAVPAAASIGHVVLSVDPVPTTANPSPGTPQVRWSTGNGSPGLVTVAPDGAKEVLFASGPEGSASASWIAPGQSYVFRLYSLVSGRRLLARLKIGQNTAAEVVALPPSPKVTSAPIDRLLQVLSFAAVAILVLLAAVYLRDLRHDG